MRTAAGIATEAVYIFHNMLRKLKAGGADYLYLFTQAKSIARKL